MPTRTDDLVEIQQLLARYAVTITQQDIDGLVTPVIELNGDTATGTQPLCFIDHASHDMRIGYYNDTYVRTDDGWRLKTRAMTFIRRSGAHDSGRPHAVGRPPA